MENEDLKKIRNYCIGFFAIIIFILILYFSFGGIRYVAFDEYGIQYYTFTAQVSDKILTEGTHWLSTDSAIFYFKRTLQQIKLQNFECMSLDGIKITMNINIQYQLNQEKLIEVLFDIGENEDFINYITIICRNSISNSCTKFEASDFSNKRNEVQEYFEFNLQDFIKKNNDYCSINFIQLENYEFPDRLDDAIDLKQQSLQDKEQALNEREGQLTIAETKKLAAQINANIIIIKAQAEVNSIILEANTTSSTINSIWDNRQQSYILTMNNFEMNADQFINNYLYNQIIQNSKNIILNNPK